MDLLYFQKFSPETSKAKLEKELAVLTQKQEEFEEWVRSGSAAATYHECEKMLLFGRNVKRKLSHISMCIHHS